MKFNLPPKSPRVSVSETAPGPASTAPPNIGSTTLPKGSFYRTAEEAARRKQAILAQMEHRRMIAKAALHAGRLAGQSSHL